MKVPLVSEKQYVLAASCTGVVLLVRARGARDADPRLVTPTSAVIMGGLALSKVGYRGFLGVAKQDEPTPLLDVQALRRRVAPQQLNLFDALESSVTTNQAAGPSR